MGIAGRNNFVQYTTMLKAKNDVPISGDAFEVILSQDEFLAAIVDGLGSGVGANESAALVIEEFNRNREAKLSDILNESNKKMLGHRGAVAAIIRIRFEKRIIEFSGLGNIKCYIFRKEDKKIVYPRSRAGYLSGENQEFIVQAMNYKRGDFFLLHTDGIDIENLHSLLEEEEFIKLQALQSPNLIIKNDDATFIAGRLF